MVSTNQSTATKSKHYKWWLRIGLITLCMLCIQSGATLLGGLYYEKGGKSQWLATLMQLAGFPILILYYCFSPLKNSTASSFQHKSPTVRRPLRFSHRFVSLGLLVAAFCFLYSTGLQYLPVYTYSLICTSQLVFNAFFSYFFNSQKFTPSIINSLILLTISSILLVSQEDSSAPKNVLRGKCVIGFICTIAASASNRLALSLTQFCFQKVKKGSFSAVMDMIIYQSLVAASAITVGLFISREWKGLRGEMEEYELGKIPYVMVLVWICVLWQGCTLGGTSLLFEVSSLFTNAIIVVAFPVVLILSVIFLDNEMDCIGVATVLAIWGVLSYAYQQYLDDQESKSERKCQ